MQEIPHPSVRYVAFTGTQRGMTPQQKDAIREFLTGVRFVAVHGGCIGADADFHDICIKSSECEGVIIHPSNISSKTMVIAKNAKIVWVHEPKPPLSRNYAIVNGCSVLVAAPKELRMTLRSGTWATVRYARQQKKPIVIVGPDGNLYPENI